MNASETKREASTRSKSKFLMLTPRERQVLRQVVAGERTKDIASQLGLSVRTVEVYRAHLKMKLHARSVGELVRVAVLEGFLDSE